MTYEEARKFMEDIFTPGIVLGTVKMQNLLKELGNPEEKLQFVHIAGTNGKGSTLSFISNILQCAGYKVGRYASPRVFAYEEFVQVNLENIEKDSYVRCVEQISAAVAHMKDKGLEPPSGFECETAIGFLYFVEKQCDAVVLECGMGGKEDATNVVSNLLCNVICPIGLDHMSFLGNTIEEITYTKSGIIVNDAPVCVGRQTQGSIDVLKKVCDEMHAPMTVIDEAAICAHEKMAQGADGAPEIEFDYKDLKNVKIRLLGRYQLVNAALAIEACRAIDACPDNELKISDEDILKGLEMARWPGRFDTIHTNPTIIVDGAHNPHGIEQLKNTLEYYYPDKKLIGVMGVLADKSFDEEVEMVAPLFKKMFTVTPPENPRALEGEKLAEVYQKHGLEAVSCATVAEGIRAAAALAGEDDSVIVFGSLSYLGEAVKACNELE